MEIPGFYSGSYNFRQADSLIFERVVDSMDIRLTTAEGNIYTVENFANTGNPITVKLANNRLLIESQPFSPGVITGDGELNLYDGAVRISWSSKWSRGNEIWYGSGNTVRQ